MYPLQPNTENYYIDNIKSTPLNPIYIPNLDLHKGTSNVKTPILERFSIDKEINYIEIVYLLIIIILIYFLIVNRKIY
jgi:hypothetical protein